MTLTKKSKITLLLAAIVLIISVYYLTPLSEYLNVDKISSVASNIPENGITLSVILLLFFIGGSTFIPIPLICLATGLIFGIAKGLVISIIGFFLASISGYFIGLLIDPEILGQKYESSLNKVSDKLDKKGPIAVAILRLAPTPPFTVTSVVSGTVGINFYKYSLASVLGIAPLGLSAIFFGKSAIELMKEPSMIGATFLIASILLFVIFKFAYKNTN